MNSDEKLEQSCIVKEKGTQSFKVSVFTLWADFVKEWVIFHSACVDFRKVNTSRRQCSTKRSFHGWNMSPGCQTRMRRKQKRCDWLHIWTWPCASSRWRSPARLWKTVTRYRFYGKLGPHEKNGRRKLISSTVPSTSAVITTKVWMMILKISWSLLVFSGPGVGSVQWESSVPQRGGSLQYERVWQGQKRLPASGSAVPR